MNFNGIPPDRCPHCRKDLSVYNRVGAWKHIERCSKQLTPTYAYRASKRVKL